MVITLTGCSIIPDRGTAKPELIENVRVKVDLLTVRLGTLTVEMNGAGVVVPASTEYMSFEIDGKLEEAALKRGDRVKKGDVLLRLDSSNFEVQRTQQQLAVENMQAELAQSINTGNVDDIRINQMNLEIEQMKLNRLLDRQRKSVLVSPTDGIVTFLDGVERPGFYTPTELRSGSPIVAYKDVVGIAQTDQLQIQYVGDLSAYLSDIEIGMPVVLRYQGAPIQARVAVTPLTAPPIDSDPRRAEILGKTLIFDFMDAIPSSLSIGDNIEYKLLLTRKDNVLIIPRGALRNYQGRQFVQILEGETRREADVQVGLMTPTEVEIVRGLKEGQQIIVNH
jgi:hypothetical protein